MNGLLKGLAAVAILAAAARPAEAQASQTVNVPTSSTSGWYFYYWCSPTEVASWYDGATCRMSWTDTVGTDYVSVRVTLNFIYNEVNGGYRLRLNGVDLPNPMQISEKLDCGPGSTTITTTFSGVTGFVPGGSNTLEVIENGDFLILDNNASGWAVQIVVTDLNSPPTASAVQQVETASSMAIATGSTITTTSVDFAGTVSDPNLVDPLGTDLTWDVEVKPVGTAFNGTGLLSVTVPNGAAASVTQAGLAIGLYHWRYRVTDPRGATTGWISYGGNPESAADFEIIPPPPPPNPPDGIDHGGGDGLFGDKLTCGAGGGAGHGALLLLGAMALLATGLRLR